MSTRILKNHVKDIIKLRGFRASFSINSIMVAMVLALLFFSP